MTMDFRDLIDLWPTTITLLRRNTTSPNAEGYVVETFAPGTQVTVAFVGRPAEDQRVENQGEFSMGIGMLYAKEETDIQVHDEFTDVDDQKWRVKESRAYHPYVKVKAFVCERVFEG